MTAADLNFHHLRLFWEVARSGSLRAAADKLHLSQPTISAQIKSLEESLGLSLFDRTGRGMKVNSSGELLMDYANELFSVANEMVRSIHGLSGARSLRMNLGILQSLPKLVAWRLIRPALAAMPNLQLSCTEGHPPELLGMLVSGRLDAILADEPAPASLHVRAFSKRLHRAPCVFCATPELARRLRQGFPKSLHEAPALLPAERTPWRHRIDRWFEAGHVRPRIVAEFDDAALMKTAAADGLGFVPVLESVMSEAVSRYGLAPIGSAAEAGLSCYLITVERTSRHPGLAALTTGARDMEGRGSEKMR
ncbi:MAG TPA: LysR family transcriptional regulator [Prosthecobacter sp.]|nr:LysR family transcriptional regulator [Prosthecobacter sp.]